MAEDVDTPKSLRSHRSQRSSDVVSARARYSASVLERAIKVCFLLRQEIKEDILLQVSRLRMMAAAGPEPETMTETRQRFNGEWLQQQL